MFSCRDHRICDSSSSGNWIGRRVRGQLLDSGCEPRVATAGGERCHDLLGGGGDAIGRVALVDARGISSEAGAAVAFGRHPLGPRETALDRVDLDDDVGDLRLDFLRILELDAVVGRGAAQQANRQAFRAIERSATALAERPRTGVFPRR